MKKILFSMIFCFTISKTVAQDNPTIQAIEEIPNWPVMLTNLNPSQITSGVLVDKVTTFSNLINYNTPETNTSGSEHFVQALSELYRASDQTRFISLSELKNRTAITNASNSTDVGFINTTFEKLNFNEENPKAGGLLFSNGMFNNIAFRPAFVSKKIIIAAPLKQFISGNSFIFNFKNNLVFNNATTNIQTLDVDFEDNLPPTRIISNGIIVIPSKNVIYSGSGMKTLKFSMTFADNSSIETYGKIYVNYGLTASRLTPSGTDTLCYELLKDKGVFTSTDPYQGYTESSPVNGKIEYTIFYGDANTAKKMVKPIIFVDGFDPNDKRKVLDCDCELDDTCKNQHDYNGNGVFNPEDHISIEESMYYSGFPLPSGTVPRLNLMTELRRKGYDVIIINNPTYTTTNLAGEVVIIDGGADYIERNARTLASYMQNIKTQQNIAGSSEKLVLVGPSMGGQITRYALAYMEKKFAETNNPIWKHNARLWVSVDSPHLGANIPVGAQASIWFLGEKLGKEKAKKQFNEELNSVAGKQQIISQFKNGLETGYLNNNFFFNTYYNNLNTNGVAGSGGYPVSNSTFRKIAMVNGSLTGKKDALEQQSFLYMRGYIKVNPTGFIFNPLAGILTSLFGTVTVLRIQDNFMPAYGQSSTVFKGDGQNKNFSIGFNHWNTFSHPRYSLSVNNNSIKGCLDIIPGGYFQTAKYIKEAVEEGLSNAGMRSETRDYLINHSFIPTFSALGHLNPNQSWSNPLNTNLTCPSNKQTPFDSYYGTTENTEHISFTKESAAWLFKELDNNPQAPYFPIEESLIRGNPYMCKDKIETYTIYDICKTPSPVKYNNQAGIPVNGWSVEGNIVIISSTPYTVTVKGTSDVLSDGKIIATYQNGLKSIKLVKIGIPVVANQTITGGYDNVGIGSSSSLSLSSNVAGATNYRWTVTALSTNISCGCTTDSNGLIYCPPSVIKPKFSETGTAYFESSFANATVNWGNCPGMYLVTCYAKSTCGDVFVNIKNVVVFSTTTGGGGNPCPGSTLRIYPNPVKNGNIEVNIIPPVDPCNNVLNSGFRTTNLAKENDIKIYDLTGFLVHSKKYYTDSFSISNLNLKKGNYILNITTEMGKTLKEIVIIE